LAGSRSINDPIASSILLIIPYREDVSPKVLFFVI